jgi:hypothetical protein
VRVPFASCGALLGAVLAITSMAALLRYLRTLPQPRGGALFLFQIAEDQIERLRIIMSARPLARCLLAPSAKYILQRSQRVSVAQHYPPNRSLSTLEPPR